jgi:molybdopterin synthase sulfur carrier subunit
VITVLFFAQLREQLQCEKLNLALPADLTITALREQLIELHPTWLEFLTSDKLLFSVNQTLVKASHIIQDGDEVAFFPPVTGG